jgi:hypothetical protein
LPSHASSSADPGHAFEIAVVGIEDRQSETSATARHRSRRLLVRLGVPQRNNRNPDVAQDSADDETKKRSAARDQQPLQFTAEVTQGELVPVVEEIAKARDLKNFQDIRVKVEATRPDFGIKVEQQRGKELPEASAANGSHQCLGRKPRPRRRCQCLCGCIKRPGDLRHVCDDCGQLVGVGCCLAFQDPIRNHCHWCRPPVGLAVFG